MTEVWAFYLRLSMADGDLGKDNKDESNSIENQRELLKAYIEANDDLVVDVIEYIDDGHTGTNFNRPAFRRMIDDAKKGKIQTILVKDLSRLGRDYIGVGDYLEQIFPVLGVRFIAVNSNYDSNKYIGRTMGLDMAVNNLVNNLYSRDISKKVKAGFRARWKQGVGTSGRPPYGYDRDVTARGHWRIDHEAAEVIRIIFERASRGQSIRQIVHYLNEQQYDTPSIHREKKNQFGGTRKVAAEECMWDANMVRTILKRYEYTGAFVHSQRESIQLGSNVTRVVPEHQRYVIEDGHDAIISKELYDNAQIAVRTIRKAKFKIENDYPLRGKIRCGVCNLAMSYLEMAYEAVIYCHHRIKTGEKSNCCEGYIPIKSINHAVYNTLKVQLKFLQELGLRMEENKGASTQKNMVDVKRMEREMEVLKAERIRQYEAYAEGVVSREQYTAKREEISAKVDTLQTALDRLRSLMEEDATMTDEVARISEKAKQSMVHDTLTKEMAEAFIETVYVFDEKTIEVEFKFDDLLHEAAKKWA